MIDVHGKTDMDFHKNVKGTLMHSVSSKPNSMDIFLGVLSKKLLSLIGCIEDDKVFLYVNRSCFKDQG